MSRYCQLGVLIVALCGLAACRVEGRFDFVDAAVPDDASTEPDAAVPEAPDAQTDLDAATTDATAKDGDVGPDVDAHTDDAAVDGNCVAPKLAYCDLRGVDLSGKDLRGWNLSNADLRGADLRDTNLEGTNLNAANLEGAKLEGARAVGFIGLPLLSLDYKHEWLTGTTRIILGPGIDLSGLDFTDFPLDGRDLRGANLGGAILQNTVLHGLRAYDLVACPKVYPATIACLSTANRRYALIGPSLRLDGANLDGLWLVDGDLSDVHAVNLIACPSYLPADWSCIETPQNGRFALVGPRVDLSAAKLDGANFDGLVLTSANLSGATVTGASFVGTVLTGTHLGGLDWTDTDLTDAVLDHATTTGLLACPSKLSPAYRCVPIADTFVILGPGVTAPYLALQGVDLDAIDLTGANIQGAHLSGVSLANATLEGVNATWLSNCPDALPAGWVCAWTRIGHFGAGPYRALLGPGVAPLDALTGLIANGVDLTNADFRGATLTAADLRDTTLTGARFGAGSLAHSLTGPIKRCPVELPDGYHCLTLPGSAGKVLLGPQVVVRGLDLTGLDLGGMDLHGIDMRGCDLTDVAFDGAMLESARATNLEGCPSTLPSPEFRCVAQPDLGLFSIVGPGMSLQDVNLRGADLADVSLMGAFTLGTRLFDLEACPATLPSDTGWSCVMQPQNGKYALIGPHVDLRGADLSDADLTGAVLNFAQLSEASFANADLTGAQLQNLSEWRGTDLTGALITGAQLDGSTVRGLTGCPVLPDDSWQCVATGTSEYALFGPMLVPFGDFVGADLTGVDFASSDSACPPLRAFDLTACPAALPAGWLCVEQPMTDTYALIGPGADLRGADLRGVTLDAGGFTAPCSVDLRGANVGGAHLMGLPSVRAQDLLECPDELPDSAWQCFAQGDGTYALAGPGVQLEDIDLDDATLADVDFSQTQLFNVRAAELDACPQALPQAFECVMLQSTGTYALLGPGADLRGLDLSGITLPRDTRAYDLIACPATLPSDTACVPQAAGRFAVIGQGADVSGADLRGADLASTASLRALGSRVEDRVRSYDLIGCPALRNWDVCIEQPANGGYFVLGAFSADLRGADLTGVNLAHVPPVGWFAANAAYDLIACPSALPGDTACVLQPANNRYAILGTDLRGADLTGVTIPPHFTSLALASDETTTCPDGDPGPCY